jgi:hypothetical protein
MPNTTRKPLLTLSLLAFASPLLVGGFIWSGAYNIGADDPHTRPVHALLTIIRQRSIANHAKAIVAGLLPIMSSGGAGPEIMQRIAAPMIGSMITTPLLSLFLIPAAFGILRRRSAGLVGS